MPRDSSGIYSLPSGYKAVDGDTIFSSQHNPPLEDIEAALTASVSRSGQGAMTANLDLGGFRVVNAAAGTAAGDLATYAQMRLFGVPPGFIGFHASVTTPAGWLPCDGRIISRTTYAELFAAIETLYGAGDGSTTFAIPDARGEFLRALDAGRGLDPARVIGSVQAAAILNHSHTATTTLTDPGHRHEWGNGATTASVGGSSFSGVSLTGGALNTAFSTTGITAVTTVTPNGGAENRPRNIAFPIIIKV